MSDKPKVTPMRLDTPDQVQIAMANDDLSDIETIVVVMVSKEGHAIVSHNKTTNERMLWMAHELMDYARYGE